MNAINRGGGAAGAIVGGKTGVLGGSSSGSTVTRDASAGLRWSVAGDQGAVVVPSSGGAQVENRETSGPATGSAGTSGADSSGGNPAQGTGTQAPPAEDEGGGLFLAVIVIVVVVALIAIGLKG